MARLLFFCLLSVSLLTNCDESNEPMVDLPDSEKEQFYFPPLSGNIWEQSDPVTLGWDDSELEELYNFLETNNTRAFLVLKDGKMVVEKYWGENILKTRPFDQNTNWYWASAGKTLTAFLVGKAQEQGALDIQKPTSTYLGTGWTSFPGTKEDLITVRHQLTMSTGLDYEVDNIDCTLPECLQYKNDPGNQWFYHNAPYTLLEQVVSQATGTNYNDYTDQEIESKIGMSGQWIKSNYNNVYWSTARDAARFGLLILNKGDWNGQEIMQNKDYLEDMTTTSQLLNPSYGYLWWLNGKSTIIYPGLPRLFQRSLAPSAPGDLFAAMGKNGQFIDIVPSEGLVVVRMGEAPDGSLVPIQFHDDLWNKMMAVLQ